MRDDCDEKKFAADKGAMLLIDRPVGVMGWVKSIPFEDMKRNALILANPAKILTLILFLCVTGCMLAFPHMARAQVSLPTVNLGDTNFEDGIAGPGFLAEEFPGYYTASEMKDANGNTTLGRNRVTAVSTTTHIAFLSKKHLWGGLYGGEVLLPLVDLDVNLANGTSGLGRFRLRGSASS